MGIGRLDLTDAELRTIACAAMAVQRKKPSRYMEVGVFGGGTIKFVTECAPGIHCTGVDLFEDFQANSSNTHINLNPKMEDVSKYLGPDVRLLKGDSSEILLELARRGERFDFIFIDGNHKYEATKKDYNNSLQLLEKGGFIAFHNSSPHMNPDWDLYNKIDGGPWQVVTEIKISKEMTHIGDIDRLSLFAL